MALDSPVRTRRKEMASVPPPADRQWVGAVLRDTLEYARTRDYVGWDYSDGISSAVRRRIPIESKWLNLVFQETAKRAPVNIRPLLLVEQRRSYMGAALFAMANWNAHRLRSGTDVFSDGADVDYRGETKRLLDWLVETRRRGYAGFCGGHNHPIQQLDCLVPIDEPDVVDTSFAVKALLVGSDLDPSYSRIAKTAADFVVEDLDYRTVDGGARINYHPTEPGDYYTLNAGGLAARLLIDLYEWFETPAFRDRAARLLDYIVSKQTDRGGWYYREPPSASHISMDTHHNGFIIECLLRYRQVTAESRYDEAIEAALQFFHDELFEPDGAPNWDEANSYPRDVHASAVGALVFTYTGNLDIAERILRWAVDNLYNGAGRFYYRQHRYYTKRITLMRWCQAWMAFALSEYAAVAAGRGAVGID